MQVLDITLIMCGKMGNYKLVEMLIIYKYVKKHNSHKNMRLHSVKNSFLYYVLTVH